MPGTRLPIDLGDGLILRQATLSDHDALVEFNSQIHTYQDGPSEATGASTSDLFGLRQPHPGSTPGDFTIVEDVPGGMIVSSLCLIPQAWNYGGIHLPATLIELVGTRPEYRNRGLVRRQFEVVHGWCEDRGIIVQGISGIPWYYRQFGYEYALHYGTGRVARRSLAPKLEGDEPVRVRTATVEDAAFIADLEESNRSRWMVTAVRDENTWRYEISGRNPVSDSFIHVNIVERMDGTPIGYFAYAMLPGDPPWIVAFDVVATASWLDVGPTVLRHMLAVVDARAEERTEVYVAFELGADHPAYDALPSVLSPSSKSYALYVRVPDFPAFLQRIAPVLEQRLAKSVAHGFSGELQVNLYRDGLKLMFESGRLASVTRNVWSTRSLLHCPIKPSCSWYVGIVRSPSSMPGTPIAEFGQTRRAYYLMRCSQSSHRSFGHSGSSVFRGKHESSSCPKLATLLHPSRIATIT